MRKTLLLALLAIVATALFAWALLRHGGGAADGSPLAFAPADTPYAMGVLEPFPEAMTQDWMQRMEPVLPLYARNLRQVARAAAEKPASAQVARVLDALADEFEGRDSQQILAATGMGADARAAIYGLGLVPVLRLELADTAAFHALVGRIEQKSGGALPTATVAGQDYWRLPIPDAPIEGVAAVVGQHLVLSLAPVDAPEPALKTLLGLEPPAKSLVDTDVLDELAKRFDYLPLAIGFIDSRRVLEAVTGDATALDQAFLAALGIDKPQLDPTCREEYLQLTALWPGASFGYTRVDPDFLAARAVLEIAPELARDLMGLRAPMPALPAVDTDVAFNLGLSYNLDALPPLVNKRAGAIASAPYACKSLAGLNTAAGQARSGINNPALYAMAPVFRGFHLIVESFALGPDFKPTALSGALVIGSPNPQSLLAMAAMAVPQVSSLGLVPDGSVKKLDLPPLPDIALDIPAWASMTDTLLGIGFGAGADQRLPGYMQTDADRQPLLVLGYSGQLYATLADIMESSVSAMPDEEAAAEIRLQAELMRDVYAKWIRRGELSIEFTEHGVEMLQEIETNAP